MARGSAGGNSQSSTAEIRFGQKWMLIAGIAAMVLGVGYFLKYSFDQNWISHEMRIAMAFLTGLGLLGAGEFSRRKNLKTFGLYLIGGGIATLYFSTYAADQIYALISTTTAFGLMIGVTVLACSLAVFYDTKWLAVLGLIGGFASPMVLGSSDSNQLTLLSYITVLNAGILSIAFFKRWRLLYNLSFLATWSLYFVSLFTLRGTGDDLIGQNLFFVSLFFVTYTVVPYLRSILSKENAKLSDFSIALPNAAIAFGFSYTWLFNLELDNWSSAISISYATLFGSLAAIIHLRNPENRTAIVLLLGKASLFLVLTVPLLVSGNWITLFWFIEAVVLLGIGLALKERLPVLGATALLALTIGKFFYHDYPDIYGFSERLVYFHGYSYLLWGRLATILTAVGSTFAFAVLVSKKGEFLGESWKTMTSLFQTLFGFLLFTTLNIETVAFFSQFYPASRDASLSVLWTLFSVGLMSLGFLHYRKPLRSLSIALFGVTAAKVLLFDLAHVDTPYRVLSLVVLGVMLIGASFLYHKFAGRILEKREVVL
ncbi:MAG: DUF2339 domain-containing protein [Candidatus Omnitrophica bacterium]|nr:DUF2339 domain-containing protein [Candidatus Omnitrophota bacterium]